MAQFNKWVEKAAWGLIVFLATGAISWAGWATVQIADKPSEIEVRRMMAVETPYVQDRALILETLNETKDTNRELRRAIDNNTRAIIQLEATMQHIAQEHDE